MMLGMGSVAVVLVATAVLAVPLIRFIRLWFIFNKFEGPPAIPFVGNTYQFKHDPIELVQQVNDWFETYREKSKGLMRLWLGVVPTLFIYDAQVIETILSNSRHIKKGFVYSFLEPWLGLGLLTSSGQKWFHRRKMLTPAFHFAVLQNFIDVFNEQSIIMCQKLDQLAHKSVTVDICPYITLCVLDIISETAMGIQMNAQGNGNNEYVEAVIRMSDLIQQRQKKPWTWPDVVYDSMNSGKEHAKCLRILHDMTNMIITERKNQPPKDFEDDDNKNNLKKRIAFLDLLLKMHREDPSFTLDDIREEVDTFMFEGHDTTAALAYWAMFLIGHHTKVQRKLHQELDEIFGDSDRPVTSDDLQKLTYLACVLKETLRIFPSVPAIGRDILEDCVIDGKLLPKGSLALVAIGAVHRDPLYFPNPLMFDPDRFLPENSAKRHPYAYIPFSAGPRNCIGQRFAMMEDKVLVATVLRRFSVESLSSIEEVRPMAELILRPSSGIHVKLTRRK
ncbi:cytochrome P450 4V2-like [Diadema setosum]|uniref:cytochrome P450 4V2-like n=1 Tax=Diadema setosum TaxID=31175 RepID=UPI003B3B356C